MLLWYMQLKGVLDKCLLDSITSAKHENKVAIASSKNILIALCCAFTVEEKSV